MPLPWMQRKPASMTDHFDESTITGESLPVVKGPGDRVFEATVNLHTVLTMEVLRPVAESTVARMIAMVTEAQAQKAADFIRGIYKPGDLITEPSAAPALVTA